MKASATVGTGDLKGLRALEEIAGAKFHRGFVLYAGRETIPFGPRMHALPLDAVRKSSAPRRSRN